MTLTKKCITVLLLSHTVGIAEVLTSRESPWLAVTLHRMCIITVIIALRLVGGCHKGPVCLHVFQLLLLVAAVSHLCGLNLSDKGGVPPHPTPKHTHTHTQPGTLFIHVSECIRFIFAATASLDSHLHLLGWWKKRWSKGVNATLWSLGAKVEIINSFTTDIYIFGENSKVF